jgi:hypothetical protein
VIRGGFGIFYDRIGLNLFETAALNNGVNQLQYTVYNPVFYPNIPSLSTLSAGQNSIYRVDPKVRADYSMQGALGVERQLPRNTTLALTYSYNRTDHMAQTIPVNTPLPGTFDPTRALSATNGVFPYGYSAGSIYETESGGYMRQQMLMFNFNTRFSSRISLFGNYSLNFAKDLPSSPTDPYDYRLDWGRSTLDRRHNFIILGTITGPRKLRFSPFVTLRSGQPYDVLTGEDLFGDNLINTRAAFSSSNASCGSVIRSADTVCSPFGTFTSAYSVTNLANLVPRNYLTMPGLFSVNMRVERTFGFGGRPKSAIANQQGGMPSAGMMGMGGGGRGPGGPGGGGPGGGGGFGGPGGPMGMGGGGGEHPYNVTFSLNVENVFNHLNPGGYQGVITNPYFLQATSVNTGFGGGGPGGGGPGGFGGGGAANNRRLTLGVRFSF